MMTVYPRIVKDKNKTIQVVCGESDENNDTVFNLREWIK